MSNSADNLCLLLVIYCISTNDSIFLITATEIKLINLILCIAFYPLFPKYSYRRLLYLTCTNLPSRIVGVMLHSILILVPGYMPERSTRHCTDVQIMKHQGGKDNDPIHSWYFCKPCRESGIYSIKQYYFETPTEVSMVNHLACLRQNQHVRLGRRRSKR